MSEVGQVRPEGPPTRNPAVAEAFWRDVWNSAEGLPANLPPVTEDSPELRRPVDRLYEALGSTNNAAHFTLLEGSVNAIKGRIEVFNSPMAENRFRTLVRDAAGESGGEAAETIQSFMAPLRETRAVFQYLSEYDVVTRIDTTASAVHSELQLMEQHLEQARGYVKLSFLVR